GRVFSADLGFSMLTIAIGAYVCGIFLDRGVSAQEVASATGIIMLLPALLWAWAMKSDRRPRGDSRARLSPRAYFSSWSILAAMMKSLWVRPSILCVHRVISAFPHASRMSG